MRTTLSLLSICSLLLLGGCGGCGDDSGGPDAGPTCRGDGLSCTTSDECCTGNCDEALAVCAQIPGTCLAGGMECQTGNDCCSHACVDFTCSNDQCTADGASCDNDGECCSGNCDGTCLPLNETCRTSGNPCSSGADCCSNYCVNDVCDPDPSYCTQAGDACSTDLECCGGSCALVANGLGLCELAPATGAGSCLSAGEACDDYAEGVICGGACCSRACFPYGPSGIPICQPPSGCRPTGETCFEDADCCGSAGLPNGDTADIHCIKIGDNPIGRCDNGEACTPAGGICRLSDIECNENANCCSGNTVTMNTCAQDNLGIPRCLAAEIDCVDPTDYIGQPCATSADCCGLPCTPESTDEFAPLVCGGETCVAMGGICTTTADCCAGLPCNVPQGETTGTCGDTPSDCAEYGQACDVLACCNDVPCENGVCGVIVP